MSFGRTLAQLRRQRGWSQEDLALRAGVSQRHVSFLETGRARPGQKGLGKLAAALVLRGWEQRALMDTLAPAAAHDAQTASPDFAFVASLMPRFSPWPAYAFRIDGALIATNCALDRLLDRAAPNEDLWHSTAPSCGPNIYDLVFHPHGLARWLVNPEEVVPETLRRLRIEAAHDAALLPVVARVEAYASVEKWGAPRVPPSVLIERYRFGDNTLSIVSMIAHLASPGELELDLLRIESFIPADQKSELLLSHM